MLTMEGKQDIYSPTGAVIRKAGAEVVVGKRDEIELICFKQAKYRAGGSNGRHITGEERCASVAKRILQALQNGTTTTHQKTMPTVFTDMLTW